MIKVLFVCLGNICRSPLVEAVFQDLVASKGLEKKFFIDSAGTSRYHLNELPDPRTIDTLRSYGLTSTHLGRQVTTVDFQNFDYIIAMDKSNLSELRKLGARQSDSISQLFLLREFEDTTDLNVPDPYYGGTDGFEFVYSIAVKTSENFLDFLIEKHNL